MSLINSLPQGDGEKLITKMVYAESELGFKTDTGALLTIEYYEDALKPRNQKGESKIHP